MRLSICIPTHNRYPFLKWTVSRLKEIQGDIEIVISDNHSDDDTRCIQLQGVRYIEQYENIGAFPNLRAALLAGQGEYVCYCGDDDYLLDDRLQEALDWMDAHPEVVAYFAPCELYDEVAQAPNWEAFYIAKDETFTEANTLWNFLIQNHVWPEHAIFRRSGLEAILQPRIRAYWAFVDLGHAFAQGPVHFARKPYYRNITNHPVGHRAKLGDQQCLTDFDEYRAGLENLAYELFKAHLSDGLKVKLRAMINHFINVRLGVAHRLFTLQGREAEAKSIEKRLAVCA